MACRLLTQCDGAVEGCALQVHSFYCVSACCPASQNCCLFLFALCCMVCAGHTCVALLKTVARMKTCGAFLQMVSLIVSLGELCEMICVRHLPSLSLLHDQ